MTKKIVPTRKTKRLTRTEEIAQLLGVTIEVAEAVREEMDCSGLDYSECTQAQFNAQAKASFEYLYRYMMKDEPLTIVVVEKPEVVEPSSIAGLKSEWCKCVETTESAMHWIFMDDGECTCGCGRHHYHCPTCGGVTQTG